MEYGDRLETSSPTLESNPPGRILKSYYITRRDCRDNKEFLTSVRVTRHVPFRGNIRSVAFIDRIVYE